MDAEMAKRVIRDQEEEITTKLRSEKIIAREFLKGAGEVISSPNALVLKGVRRCGKSVASILLAREGRFAYVNFDDPTLAGIHQSDLRTIVEAIYSLKGDFETLVLDEVQNAVGWELLVSRLRETKRVIVTGSNASLLSREFSTSLTGRYVGFTAFPFSFREHLDMLGPRPDAHLTKDIAQIKNLLEGYLRTGGFPETRKFGERFLLQIYDDIIAKDVERRYNLRFRQTFRDMARYIMSNAAKELTFNKLKNIFGLSSVHTARNYVGYLEDAYLIFSLQRYHPKLKMQMMAPRKAYCIDTGIVNILTSSAGEDRGRLMENLVAVELWRRISYWNPRFTLNYWKNHAGDEVDFVLREGRVVKSLIQVCYDPSDPETRKREVSGLLKASEELSCRDMLVVTWEHEARERAGTRWISFVPLWKWLLSGRGRQDGSSRWYPPPLKG